MGKAIELVFDFVSPNAYMNSKSRIRSFMLLKLIRFGFRGLDRNPKPRHWN